MNQSLNPHKPSAWQLGLGFTAGLTAVLFGPSLIWILQQLVGVDVPTSLAEAAPPDDSAPSVTLSTTETDAYVMRHSLTGGIERFTYTPKVRRFATPIVLQHGLWHGGWCWQQWQEVLAELGWESHAHSLPGHGRSPEQRPIRECTLDYNLRFLKAEVDRLPRKPVIIGHSMGGALAQWYLKYVGDDLPAAVLVASAVSHSMVQSCAVDLVRLDPLALPLALWNRSATPIVRTPAAAARALISDTAVYTPDDLFARLDAESLLPLFQHNPPFWSPPTQVRTPLLWLAPERDTVVSEKVQRRSAAFYGADYQIFPGAAHNLMMERYYRETAVAIHHWLQKQGVE